MKEPKKLEKIEALKEIEKSIHLIKPQLLSKVELTKIPVNTTKKKKIVVRFDTMDQSY